MLEKRKLKVVCFKATLTKTKNSVRLDIEQQLVRQTPVHGAWCPDLVDMVAVPELRDDQMFLLGNHREIPEREKNISIQNTTQYWETHKENLVSAGRWIKQLVEKGHYGYGKQYRRDNR